jgi:dihydrofolate reductase
MRKIVLLMHVSLDGFVGGPNGEMDWIHVDDEMFDTIGRVTDDADTAIYGRVTYQMMESYWPTAAEQPTATKHDIEHANWVNAATKIVISKTLKTTSWNNTTIVHDSIPGEIQKLRQKPGKNLLMIGSPSTVHSFMQYGLIDEYRLYVNPIILGNGIPLFKGIEDRINLKLLEAKTFKGGVVGLHYETQLKE